MNSPIILAVDTNEIDIAKRWVSQTSEYVGLFKLGLEFYLRFGAHGVREIQSQTDKKIFLDLKLHDIPNTVNGAAKQVADLKPRFLTVHASGGREMVKAAVTAAPDIEITAVTILTSLNQMELTEIGFNGSTLERATELAKLAVSAGARAIVCSPLEISTLCTLYGSPHSSSMIEILRPLGVPQVCSSIVANVSPFAGRRSRRDQRSSDPPPSKPELSSDVS
mgnify:CR=1 FL=1